MKLKLLASFLLILQSWQGYAGIGKPVFTLRCGTYTHCTPSKSISGYADDLAYIQGIFPSFHLKNQNSILAYSRPFAYQPQTALKPDERLTGIFGTNGFLLAVLYEKGLYRSLLDHKGEPLGDLIESHLGKQFQILSAGNILAELNWNPKSRIWRMEHLPAIQPEVCLILAAFLTPAKKSEWVQDLILSTLGGLTGFPFI